MTTPAKRGIGTGVVIAIATGAFLAGCVGGCTFGVLTTKAQNREATGITRTSPVPITATRDDFSAAIRGVPVSDADAQALAASACLAFKQNPGTTMDSAAQQLAPRQSWTYDQARQFLRAATTYHCPEYMTGS
ncbi:DUF732 domain-containing protein [Mycolicibacterium fortuitum]|uniref:DUF732 domain-containing protein n=1 Tax=Mycolicibacterium fortuitum TaxID=1766 RepID=UPI00241D26BD|nr:DUF732 domain-containing protein [Mycolicibacterium fortuitum]MDG5773896.1 DUF732 domain-containing protein [Mycolicibacterium fortuitum]MDG5779719.1 DUF732 domain-containing protein [Mycolicibacterium fortuitum]